MIASERLESSTERGKGLSGPPKIKGSESFQTWKMQFQFFLMKYGVKYVEILDVKIPEGESEEDRTERILNYSQANNTAVSFLAEACADNKEALGVLRNISLKGFGNIWASELMEKLEIRLDLKTNSRLDKLVQQFWNDWPY